MNIWVFYTIVLLSTCVLVGWTLRSRSQLLAGLLGGAIIVFTRSIQVLNPFREFGDSYYYWEVVDAILRNHHLVAPQTSEWYPGVLSLLNYPAMHLTTSALAYSTGLPSDTVRALAPAFYGLVFFAIVVALASRIVNSSWAVLVAFTISQMDAVIFYQTEYHAQNFGLVFLTLSILIIIRQIQRKDRQRNFVLLLISVLTLAYAHRFSSILAVVLLTVAGVGLVVYSFLPQTKVSGETKRDVGLSVLLFGLVMFIPHVIFHLDVVQKAVYNLYYLITGRGFGFATPSLPTGSQPTIIDQMSIIVKAVLVIAALPAIVDSLLSESRDSKLFLISILGSTGIAAVLIVALAYEVVTRVILIAFVPLALLSFTSLYRLPKYKSTITSILVVVLVLMGTVLGTTPSLIDPSSDIRSDGFTDTKPMSGQQKVSGYWIQNYATTDSTGVTAVTLHIAVNYGHQSVPNTEFISIAHEGHRYVLVDGARRPLPSPNKIYTNGRVLTGYNPNSSS